jgi:hypothetical protein
MVSGLNRVFRWWSDRCHGFGGCWRLMAGSASRLELSCSGRGPVFSPANRYLLGTSRELPAGGILREPALGEYVAGAVADKWRNLADDSRVRPWPLPQRTSSGSTPASPNSRQRG